MDCVVQMPSHLFASLYRAAKREASKQVFSLQREYMGMSSQKLKSLLQTYTFFLCPVKHQDPPSIPARHPEIFLVKVASPPLSVFLPLSYFSPHPPCIHTLSVHLPIHIPVYPSTVPHHLFSTILAVEQYFFKADRSILCFFVLIQIRSF